MDDQKPQERMTAAERSELAKLARLRAKVAKNDVEARIAVCLANFEAQVAAVYSEHDKHWAELTEEAEAAVKRFDVELAQRCRELGIPERFRPRLELGWYGRGENGCQKRRAELRLVAESRLDAQARRAKVEIERAEADIIGKIVEASVTSAKAKALLENMPSAQHLMPELSLGDVEGRLRPPTSED